MGAWDEGPRGCRCVSLGYPAANLWPKGAVNCAARNLSPETSHREEQGFSRLKQEGAGGRRGEGRNGAFTFGERKLLSSGERSCGDPRAHTGELSVCVRGGEVGKILCSRLLGGRNGAIPRNPPGNADLRRQDVRVWELLSARRSSLCGETAAAEPCNRCPAAPPLRPLGANPQAVSYHTF